MKFGYLQDPTTVDFSFPPLEVINTQVQTSTQTQTLLFIGGSKWGIREWVGNLYPKGTKAADYLHHYSRNFNTIELNASGYGLRMLDSIEKWLEQVPDGFKFSPKFPRTVSHYRKLTGPGLESAHQFLDRITDFGSKLGLPFLQMNERFGPESIDSLIDFIEDTSSQGPYAIELRHPGWFVDVQSEVGALMADHGITWAITDTPGRRDVVHSVITSNRLFVRFAAAVDPAIDHQRLDQWAVRIKTLRQNGVDTVYFNIHCMDPKMVPRYVSYLLERVRGLESLQSI